MAYYAPIDQDAVEDGHIPVPDAQERLVRAYGLVLRAAVRAEAKAEPLGNELPPDVEVHCLKCGCSLWLAADHEDVAHPFPGPICDFCEREELDRYDEEYALSQDDDDD